MLNVLQICIYYYIKPDKGISLCKPTMITHPMSPYSRTCEQLQCASVTILFDLVCMITCLRLRHPRQCWSLCVRDRSAHKLLQTCGQLLCTTFLKSKIQFTQLGFRRTEPQVIAQQSHANLIFAAIHRTCYL